MADITNPGFTAELVETWLPRKARWRSRPDAAQLAACLSNMDFTYGYVPPDQLAQRLRQITGMMRRLAVALDDPTLSTPVDRVMIAGTDYIPTPSDYARHLTVTNDPDDLKRQKERQVAEMSAEAHLRRALFKNHERLSRVLRQVADEAERQLVDRPPPLTHVDELSSIYAWVADALEGHTGSKVAARPHGPDARFVQKVIEHVGLPWHPSLWRSTFGAVPPARVSAH
jgi:hypothetical protein